MAIGLFASACFLMIASYLLYPALIMLCARFKKARPETINTTGQASASLAVIIAAHNEAGVIEHKLNNLEQLIPEGISEIWIGSDCSTDATNAILTRWTSRMPALKVVFYETRQGKIKIINDLVPRCHSDLIILTDANVIFPMQSIRKLCAVQNQTQWDLIGVPVHRRSLRGVKGIAQQESNYIHFENLLKQAEHCCFGMYLGAEGSCILMRKSAFCSIPETYKVDDFFITLQAIASEKKIGYEANVQVEEDNPGDAKAEFRRKARISSGNFQNLMHFKRVLCNPFSRLFYIFWLHKGIRWTGPLWLTWMWMASYIERNNPYFYLAFCIQTLFIMLAFASYFYRLPLKPLRSFAHFYLMNGALAYGFYLFLKPSTTSYWKPISRDV